MKAKSCWAMKRVAGLDSTTRRVATSINDLSPLRIVGLHKLKGARQGQWAMKVNGPWHICFRFARGDAHDVEVVGYHKG